MYTGKEEIKILFEKYIYFLFADHVITYLENTKETFEKYWNQ